MMTTTPTIDLADWWFVQICVTKTHVASYLTLAC